VPEKRSQATNGEERMAEQVRIQRAAMPRELVDRLAEDLRAEGFDVEIASDIMALDRHDEILSETVIEGLIILAIGGTAKVLIPAAARAARAFYRKHWSKDRPTPAKLAIILGPNGERLSEVEIDHECRPPQGDEGVDLSPPRWGCPDCGQVWELRAMAKFVDAPGPWRLTWKRVETADSEGA
jgi:hypothetical protein